MINVCEKHSLKSFFTVKPKACNVCNLEKACNILMDYFDYIPEDERQEVSDKLEKLGL